MENLKKFIFLFSLIFVSFFLVSCAGNNGAANAPAAEKAAPTQKESAQSVPSGDAKGVFSGLLANKAPTYMVTYDIKGEDQLSEMTLYFKNKNMRYDSVTHEKKSSVFILDSKMYSCSYEPLMCVFLSGQTETPQTGTEEIEKNVNNYNIIAKPSRKIAGTTAKCFELVAAQATSEVCYSNEGVPLYTKSSLSGKTFEMTATEYSTSVSDSVFTLPAEPQDINAMMAKYQTGGQ